MQREPISNDPRNPLVSVLICNYHSEHLQECLDGIFTQSEVNNFEVIFIDNAVNGDTWNIALTYAEKYAGMMTIKKNSRNNRTFSSISRGSDSGDINDCMRMARGKYVVTLSKDEAFLPAYIAQCIASMEADPFACYDRVRRRVRIYPEWPQVAGVQAPRVNVLIFNYNYGRYLRQCLDSVFAQTYPNIEIIFSDNASTDESWEIATEYARRHEGMITLIRNRKNFGPAANLENCYHNIDGKYFCVLCSDDALMPDFVEKCVRALQAHPEAGYVMTHRSIIDEHGSPSFEPPFYKDSCVISGRDQAAVYMMAAVNPSISQIMYDRAKTIGKLPGESLTSRWFAQRLLDFNLCCHYSMAYIKEPLLIQRVHSASDSSQVSTSLVEPFGQFLLAHQFAHIASTTGNMDEAVARLPRALEKLAGLCLRYCVRSLCAHDERTALRYYHLAVAVLPEITRDANFITIQQYWTADESGKASIIASLHATANLMTRSISYDPPAGSIPLQQVRAVEKCCVRGAVS